MVDPQVSISALIFFYSSLPDGFIIIIPPIHVKTMLSNNHRSNYRAAEEGGEGGSLWRLLVLLHLQQPGLNFQHGSKQARTPIFPWKSTYACEPYEIPEYVAWWFYSWYLKYSCKVVCLGRWETRFPPAAVKLALGSLAGPGCHQQTLWNLSGAISTVQMNTDVLYVGSPLMTGGQVSHARHCPGSNHEVSAGIQSGWGFTPLLTLLVRMHHEHLLTS